MASLVVLLTLLLFNFAQDFLVKIKNTKRLGFLKLLCKLMLLQEIINLF